MYPVPPNPCALLRSSIETDRSGMSSDVERRAHFELYMQAFSGAVDAGVGSAMCSYNRSVKCMRFEKKRSEATCAGLSRMGEASR